MTYNKKRTRSDRDYRRALFVYTAGRLAALAADAPVIPKPWTEREPAFQKQLIEVVKRQCGKRAFKTPEEAHQAWMEEYRKMGWNYGDKYDPDKKLHPDMVPYEKLTRKERDKDEVFLALCDIARKYIR